MSHLGCIGLGNKLQKPKKGPWSLGEKNKGNVGSGGGVCSQEGEALRHTV